MAAYACIIVESTNTYVKVKDTKSPAQYYYAAVSSAVPGYCGDVYTVDRWHLTSDGVLTVEDEGIRLTSGALFEPFEYELSSFLKGKTVTYSFLFSDNTLVTKSAVIPSTWGNWDGLIEIGDIQLIGLESGKRIWAQYSSTTTAVAAKLELGSAQTLAHQDSSGNWILNEIPDFGEQLRRCQRYRWRFCPAEYVGSAIAFGISVNAARALIYLPEQMRTNPTLNFNKNTGLFLTGVDGDIFGMTLALVWTSPNSICVEFQKSGAFAPNSVYFVRGDGSSAIDISADL